MGKIQVQDVTVNGLLKHNWVILGFRSLGTEKLSGRHQSLVLLKRLDLTLTVSFSEPSSRKMDVFPSIESANNVLVKLVAAFNKVENNMNENSFDISNQIRRLPVSEYWQYKKQEMDDEDEAVEFSDITLCSLTIALTAVFMAFMFLVYWGLCKNLQDWLSLR